MEIIEWNDKFKIGVEVVDKAHAKLFRITKKLLELSEDASSNQSTFREGVKYLEAYSMMHFSEEETYRIIAANITNLAGDGGLLLVTGTVDIERLQEFSSIILTQLNENILLVTGSDMSENADTLEALAECDAVILVEERNKSSRVKIQREQDSIEAFGKNVMGYVLL